MKIIIIICLTLLSNITLAGEIIWNYDQIDSLSISYSKNPLTLKRRTRRDISIDSKDLGKSLSPYYKIGSSIHKDYKSLLGQCYKTTQYKTKTYVRKVKCIKRKFHVLVDGRKYELLSNLEKFNENEIEFAHQSFETKIEGFHHTKYDFDQNPSSNFPFSSIDIKVESHKYLVVKNKSIEIKTIINLTRSKYTYLTQRDEQIGHTLRLEPSKGDMIFSDGANELILLKRYQPSVLRFRTSNLNPAYIEYIKDIDQHLLDYKGFKRCFRDNYVGDNTYDCDQLVFKKKSALKIVNFNYVHVNFNTSEVLIK
jgi:hypothetical protein